MASRSETRAGTVNATTAQLLSTSVFVYCDLTAAPGADAAATEALPCPTSAKVQRPYLKQSVESGLDLNGAALPTVTTTNVFTAELASPARLR